MLIAARRQGYEALAHCTISLAELRDATPDAPAFLATIKANLERAK